MAIFATLFNESILFDVAFHQLIIFINPFFHMELSGKIIMVLPERGGVSQRSGSEWKVASYILETMEQYPKKCCFEVFGTDRIANFNIQVGQMLTVSLDIDAHEFNGRWYNQIRAWKVVPYDPNAVAVVYYKLDTDEEELPRYVVGYIPRDENSELAAFLEMGWGEIFECRINRIIPDAHPEQQVHLTIKIRRNEKVA